MPIFLLTGGVVAQTPPGNAVAPGVTVVKKSWHVRAVDAAMYEDPLRPSGERIGQEAAQKQIEEDYRRTGVRPSPRPNQDIWRNPLRTPTRAVQYVFEVEIKNTGTQRIRGVSWEYVFMDAAGKRELGYRPFDSKVSVGPGRSVKLVGRVTKIVGDAAELKQAREAAERSRGKFPEHVGIRRIEYDDGSVWKRNPK